MRSVSRSHAASVAVVVVVVDNDSVPGASILEGGGLEEQSPTFFKVGG